MSWITVNCLKKNGLQRITVGEQLTSEADRELEDIWILGLVNFLIFLQCGTCIFARVMRPSIFKSRLHNFKLKQLCHSENFMYLNSCKHRQDTFREHFSRLCEQEISLQISYTFNYFTGGLLRCLTRILDYLHNLFIIWKNRD